MEKPTPKEIIYKYRTKDVDCDLIVKMINEYSASYIKENEELKAEIERLKKELSTRTNTHTKGRELTAEQAKEIACKCAKAKPKSYYEEPFEPHEWAIDAIIEASRQQEQRDRPLPNLNPYAPTAKWITADMYQSLGKNICDVIDSECPTDVKTKLIFKEFDNADPPVIEVSQVSDEAIKTCIKEIEKLITCNCDDHYSLYEECIKCGERYVYDVLPDPEKVIAALHALLRKRKEGMDENIIRV